MKHWTLHGPLIAEQVISPAFFCILEFTLFTPGCGWVSTLFTMTHTDTHACTINFKRMLPHSEAKPWVTAALGKHSFKLLQKIINVGRHCSIVPADMTCACLDLSRNRNCRRLVNTCKGNLSSWEMSLHIGIILGCANKWNLLKGRFT